MSDSDFSFMKSGFNMSPSQDTDAILKTYIENANLIIRLFMTKAIKLGTRYCVLAKRDTLTKEDVELALKYQAIDFFENTDFEKEMDDVKASLMGLMDDDNNPNGNEDEDEDEDEDIDIVNDDDELFTRAQPHLIDDYDDTVFVKKMHHYHHYWNQWTPENYFEKLIKNAIDTTLV